MSSEHSGVIFSLQRLSAHDGPGWRTLVFLKGCPLRCRWCSNPESWNRWPELAFNKDRCIGIGECTRCIESCPENAIRLSENSDSIILDRRKCNHCGDCAAVCPPQALFMYGKEMEAEEVLKRVEEDTLFYSRSAGGITLGGGEPLMQAEFAANLLERCKQRGLHTAIETCGAVPWRNVERVCRCIDHLLYDLKSVDTEKHKRYTGVANTRILNNLKKICKAFPEIKLTVRTPVIRGFNDSPEEISAIIDWLENNTTVSDYELLPYHRFGSPKYLYLGRKYPLSDLEPPSVQEMAELNALVRSRFSFQSRSIDTSAQHIRYHNT